jgi:hypothetical protein
LRSQTTAPKQGDHVAIAFDAHAADKAERDFVVKIVDVKAQYSAQSRNPFLSSILGLVLDHERSIPVRFCHERSALVKEIAQLVELSLVGLYAHSPRHAQSST